MNTADGLDATFGALADPTRRAMLARLAQGEATVTELARPFGMALPTISKHLAVLERAQLIEKRKEATRRRCRLRTRSLQEAADWLEQYARFWESAFDALEDFVRGEQVVPKRKRRRNK